MRPLPSADTPMTRPAILVAEPGRSAIDCPRAKSDAGLQLTRALLGGNVLPVPRAADLALAETATSPALAPERSTARNPATLK